MAKTKENTLQDDIITPKGSLNCRNSGLLSDQMSADIQAEYAVEFIQMNITHTRAKGEGSEKDGQLSVKNKIK